MLKIALFLLIAHNQSKIQKSCVVIDVKEFFENKKNQGV